MKLTTLPILTGLAFLFVSCGEKKQADKASTTPEVETFVLATRKYLPPAGTVGTTESSMVMRDAALTVMAGEQEMKGTATQTEAGKTTLEFLSMDKIRKLVVSKKSGGKMTMNGQDQPSPEKSDPLEGVPVILVRNGASWTASLESGATPDAEQRERLDRTVKEITKDADFLMYGDTPRKPGDKWAADPSVLSGFGDASGVVGTYAMEFVEVTEIDGVRCAVLKGTFEFTGKTDSSDKSRPMDITMKGEAISHRSIADQCDLKVEIKGTMTISGEPAPNVTIHVEGPMTMTQKITLKKP